MAGESITGTVSETVEIPLSRGDLALALGRYKTAHYIPPRDGLIPGSILTLTYRNNGDTIAVPVLLEEVGEAEANGPLSPAALKEAGRYIAKMKEEAQERPRSPATLRKHRSQSARRSARAFVQALEPPIPASLTAADIAKHERPQRITFRLLDYGNLPPGHDPASVGAHYRQAAAQLDLTLRRAHHYVFGQGRRGELMPPPNDKSSVLAMRFLAGHFKPVALDLILSRMARAAEKVALRTHHGHEPNRPAGDIYADGVGQNVLLNAPHQSIGLGTASLLMMGLTRRILTTEPPPASGNGAPLAMRLQALGRRAPAGHLRHAVELPMTVDIASERFHDRLTDALAQEHGFLDAKALRQELGLKKGQAVKLHSYPVTLTPPEELPFDTDRTGSRHNALMDATFNAWNEKSDPSVKRARAYFAARPEETQRAGIQRIAPYWAMDAQATQAWLSRNGKRPVPSDVRARRLLDGATAAANPATEKPPRNQPDPTHGNGWRQIKGWKVTPAHTPLSQHMDTETLEQLRGLHEPVTAAAAPRKSRGERIRAERERDQARAEKHRMNGIEPVPAVSYGDDGIPFFANLAAADPAHAVRLHYERPEDFLEARPTILAPAGAPVRRSASAMIAETTRRSHAVPGSEPGAVPPEKPVGRTR